MISLSQSSSCSILHVCKLFLGWISIMSAMLYWYQSSVYFTYVIYNCNMSYSLLSSCSILHDCVQILAALNVNAASMLQYLHSLMEAYGFINGMLFFYFIVIIYISESASISIIGMQHAVSPTKTKCKA